MHAVISKTFPAMSELEAHATNYTKSSLPVAGVTHRLLEMTIFDGQVHVVPWQNDPPMQISLFPHEPPGGDWTKTEFDKSTIFVATV